MKRALFAVLHDQSVAGRLELFEMTIFVWPMFNQCIVVIYYDRMVDHAGSCNWCECSFIYQDCMHWCYI